MQILTKHFLRFELNFLLKQNCILSEKNKHNEKKCKCMMNFFKQEVIRRFIKTKTLKVAQNKNRLVIQQIGLCNSKIPPKKCEVENSTHCLGLV